MPWKPKQKQAIAARLASEGKKPEKIREFFREHGESTESSVRKPNTARWVQPGGRKRSLAERVRVQERSRGMLGPVTGPQDIKKKR